MTAACSKWSDEGKPRVGLGHRPLASVGVQGRSRSSMLVPSERPSAVLVMIKASRRLSATVHTLDELIAVK